MSKEKNYAKLNSEYEFVKKISCMKIIENNHDKFPLQVRCYNCNSLIELDSKEELSQTEVCEGNEYFWTCPCCDMCNILQIDDL